MIVTPLEISWLAYRKQYDDKLNSSLASSINFKYMRKLKFEKIGAISIYYLQKVMT